MAAAPAPAPGPAPFARPTAAVDFAQLLCANLAVVGAAVRCVAARNRLSADMTDELNSRALLHLVDRDYAVLRQWRRECALPTYLTTVIGRVFLDLRNKEWGKAKVPAVARRLGAVATLLWQLTRRARLTFDEAVTSLQGEHGVQATRDELWNLYAKLPPPSSRYFVGVQELAQMEQPGVAADMLVHGVERRHLAARVERGLARALHGLTPEDRLILTHYFYDGLTLAQIARRLGLHQPGLYPRFQALKAGLRVALEHRGLSAAEVTATVGAPDLGAGPSLLAPGAASNSGACVAVQLPHV